MYPENNRVTLLVLSPGFPANETDTNCLPAQQSLILCINKSFPDVQVIILAFEYPYSTRRYHWFGNRVIPFGGRNTGGIPRMIRWIKILAELARLKKAHRVIGILSFWLGQCALLGKYFGKWNGLSHFTWVPGQDARKGNHYIKWIRPRADSLIAMSDFLARQLFVHYGIRPLHIIPNGIDPGCYQPANKKRDIDIIGVGSLIPLKQFDIFIEVVRAIKKDIPALKVLLCGEGPEGPHLSALVNQYGLTDTITLTGEKPHDEVLALMQRSRLLLHPSSYEGFSGVCLEALYAGAHVISFQQPMDGWIRHWHIAENEVSMTEMARNLLLSENPGHTPVLPYHMNDTAAGIMKLFAR